MAQIEIAMTVSGTTYRISDSDYASPDGNFYRGFVDQSPRITLGATRGGYVAVQSGTIILRNEPDNELHPFGGSRFTSLLSSQGPFATEIKYDTNYPMFQGSVVLEEIKSDQLRFSFQPSSYPTQALSTVTDSAGNTQYNPFAHGVITNRQPLIQTGVNAFRNPNLNTATAVTVHEEGTDRFSSDTTTTITTSGYNGGQVVVSGTGANGTTVEQFFDYVANSISLGSTTANTDKTSTASSRTIHLYETRPRLLTDLASEVASAVNHQFYILPDPSSGVVTLFLVDRAFKPTATALEDSDIVSTSFKLGFPLEAVVGNWVAIERKGTQLQELPQSARAENVAVGKSINVDILADTIAQLSEVITIINAIRDIEKKPVAMITVSGIKTDYRPGDRFTLNRKDDLISIDLIVRDITWDFRQKNTIIKGDATLSEFFTE